MHTSSSLVKPIFQECFNRFFFCHAELHIFRPSSNFRRFPGTQDANIVFGAAWRYPVVKREQCLGAAKGSSSSWKRFPIYEPWGDSQELVLRMDFPKHIITMDIYGSLVWGLVCCFFCKIQSFLKEPRHFFFSCQAVPRRQRHRCAGHVQSERVSAIRSKLPSGND